MNAPERIDPIAAAVLAERRELMRAAAARIVENHEQGRRVADAESLQWARDFVRLNPPLGRPLGTGEPTRACAFPTETR